MTIPPRPRLAAATLVGDGLPVPCVDGRHRPYLNLDAAASTSALAAVARAVEDFLPWYSSVHRGAGYKPQRCASRVGHPAATTWPSSAVTPPRPSTTWPTGSGWPPTTSW